MSLEDVIKQELRSAPGKKKLAGGDVMIQCPFHPGDRTPSCGVNIDPSRAAPLGFFHCFACGAKGGWNVLADKLGLTKFGDKDFKLTESFRDPRLEQRLLNGTTASWMPEYTAEFREDAWRGIRGSLVKDVGGVLGFHAAFGETRLWFPVTVFGETKAVLCAALSKKGKRSYTVYGGLGRAWFPFDYVEEMLGSGNFRKVFVVEGPRDALTLIQAGVPALALLGTQQWKESRKKSLLKMCARHGAVPVVMMDGDAAGRKAQRKITADLGGVETVDLTALGKRTGKQGLDPADLPRTILKTLRKLSTAKKE